MYNPSESPSPTTQPPTSSKITKILRIPPSPSELAFNYFAVPIYFQNPKKVIPQQVLTLLGKQKAPIPAVNYNMGKKISPTNVKVDSDQNTYYMAYPMNTKLSIGTTQNPNQLMYVYSNLCPCQGYPIYPNLYNSFTITRNGQANNIKFQ